MQISRMKKYFLLFLIVPLLSFNIHKFYVSVTNITYNEKDESFQITSRIFIDDLEALLLERYGIKGNLGTDGEPPLVDDYIEKYLNAKLLLTLNGENKGYTFLGKKYENDLVICYLEVENVDLAALKSVTVQNELLTDLYEEQKNLVHLKMKGKKKSFVLIKENNKGMLNL